MDGLCSYRSSFVKIKAMFGPKGREIEDNGDGSDGEEDEEDEDDD